MKIVYVIDSLASKGGAERVIINKMDYMVSHFGYDISIITCYQAKCTPNAYTIPNSIKQVYLGVPFYSQYKYLYPYRLWVKHSLDSQMQKSLTDAVQAIDPDILIGVSYFHANIVTGIKCRAKKVIEVHEPRPFTLSDYGLSRGRLSSLYMKHYRNWYFRKVEDQADIVVTLTPGDANEWRRAKKVQVIPNFTVMPIEKISDGQAKRVIAVGRLEWVKGYDRLISAWKIVSEKHPDWHLDIFGNGTLENELKKQQRELGLDNSLTIHPATPQINVEYSNSSFYVGTSHFEGFPLVLLEAMQVGLPCIAFDCPFGPSAVIEDGKNGFLVPDNNIGQLATKIVSLIEDSKMRNEFSKAAIERSKEFSVENVMNQWKSLFENLIK
jgi:glycosyltransferase involved in cell wall biosynthesis